MGAVGFQMHICQALIFIKYLPDWTTWLLLGAFVIYGRYSGLWL